MGNYSQEYNIVECERKEIDDHSFNIDQLIITGISDLQNADRREFMGVFKKTDQRKLDQKRRKSITY